MATLSSLINTARCPSDSLDALLRADCSYIQARGIPFSEEMLFGTNTDMACRKFYLKSPHSWAEFESLSIQHSHS